MTTKRTAIEEIATTSTTCTAQVVLGQLVTSGGIPDPDVIPVSDHCFAYSSDVGAGSSLNRTGRMSVGVGVKPPDESFRRLETAPPNSLSLSALPHRPRSSEGGCLTDAAGGLDGPGVLTHTHQLQTMLPGFSQWEELTVGLKRRSKSTVYAPDLEDIQSEELKNEPRNGLA